jgi:hypothetical protein
LVTDATRVFRRDKDRYLVITQNGSGYKPVDRFVDKAMDSIIDALITEENGHVGEEEKRDTEEGEGAASRTGTA